MEALLQSWLSRIDPDSLITVDASADDPQYQGIIPPLLSRIEAILE
jgi:hypothetical protein